MPRSSGTSSHSITKKRSRSTSRNSNNNSNSNNDEKMWSGSSKRRSKTSSLSSSPYSLIDEEVAAKLFDEIADDDDPTVAGMEGISILCEKLEIDPLEDIRILVLLWKMGSKEKPAQISKEEWMAGCRALRLDSISSFQALLPSLETGFLDQSEFKDFYKFCFQFNLHSTHRTLDKDMVVALMRMVLKGRIPSDRLETFCTFCETQKTYTRITLDQWTSFLEFCYECEDLSTYDESNSAWPVLIDEYVEYMQEQSQSMAGK